MPSTTAGGTTVRVDRRDLAAWRGLADPGERADHDPDWVEAAAAYVRAHPRPGETDRPRPGGPGVAAAQRLAILRRLAAGPAAREDVLAALRTVGWVGGSDLENRLRELRAADSRAGSAAAGVAIASDGTRYELAAPFPTLDESQQRALAFAKSLLLQLDSPLARRAAAAMDGLLPGLGAEDRTRAPAVFRAPVRALERFDAAMADRRPVRVRYFSLNSGRERHYDLVPVRYVPVGPVVKAICVPVDATGQRTDVDKQFALDRLIDVEDLPDWASPRIRLHTSVLELEVAEGLYEVMRQRNLFGITGGTAEELPDGVWRVSGTFPTALAWDVMEQLCAWSGSAQVHAPLWLVNAVCRRLRAGLRVMEEGADFTLVKPDLARSFASPGEAVSDDTPGAEDVRLERSGLARRLDPTS